MSQPSIGYVCHSCRQVLRSTKQAIVQQSTTRSFSSTPQNAKTLATFTTTSSPELDTLLTSWRNQVFLPSILPPHHQALIYKKSRHDILTTAPGVTVTVQTVLPPSAENASQAGEENIKLSPMNRFDRPSKSKSLQQICEQLGSTKETAAWDNIIPFLEGMRTARYDVPDRFLEQLTRKANEQTQYNTILRAATMVKRTGLRLSNRAVARELVLALHSRAVKSSYKLAEPSKTLKKIVNILENKEHCGALSPKDIENGHRDMRRDLVVVAAVLEQASAVSLTQHNRKDHDGGVANAVNKLVALVETLPGGIVGHIEKESGPSGDRFVLEDLVMVSSALTLASKVDMTQSLGKEENIRKALAIQEQLKKVKARIDVVKPKVQDEATGKPRRALQMLDAAVKAQKAL